MTEAPSALSARDLRVVRGGREVLVVDALDVRRGETLVVLGPNGAGKSTLLQTCALLIRPTHGEVTLFDESPHGRGALTRLRRMGATVFQSPGLLNMSARRNVETALAIRGVGGSERRRRAAHWLERLGVQHLAEAPAHTLSGGEAQRVSLARAFAVQPRILFLDEPFASLDLETRSRLVGELTELLSSEGMTAVISTHDHSEALLLATRALVLIDGRVVQEGPTASVLTAPATVAVAEFLGHSVVRGSIVAENGRLCAHFGALCIPVPAGEAGAPVEASIPPQGIAPAGAGDAGAVQARVKTLEGALGQLRAVVDVGVPVVMHVSPDAVGDGTIRPGSSMWVRIDPDRICWLS